jgi:hypothetical protein
LMGFAIVLKMGRKSCGSRDAMAAEVLRKGFSVTIP